MSYDDMPVICYLLLGVAGFVGLRLHRSRRSEMAHDARIGLHTFIGEVQRVTGRMPERARDDGYALVCFVQFLGHEWVVGYEVGIPGGPWYVNHPSGASHEAATAGAALAFMRRGL